MIDTAVARDRIEGVRRATALQQSMLYRARAEPDSGHYVEQLLLQFEQIYPEPLSRAVNELIVRYPALRSFFVWREQDEPRLVTVREASGTIEFAEAAADADFLRADRERGVALDQAPMLRVTVLTGGAYDSCLWTFHHAALDGWSIRLLLDEFLRLYGCHLRGSEVPPPQPTQMERVEAGPTGAAWLELLQGATTQPALSALPVASTRQPDYDEHAVELGVELAAAVRAWCRRERVTFASFMHTAWALLCAHLTGRNDTVFGSINSGRSRLANPDAAVGMFMELEPVRVTVAEEAGIGDFVRAYQARHWRLTETLPPPPVTVAKLLRRNPGEPLFDTVLIVQNLPEQPRWPDIGLLSVSGYEQADAPLAVSIGTGDRGSMLFRHQTHVFARDTVAALGADYVNLIRALTTHDSQARLAALFDRLAEDTGAVLSRPAACGPDNDPLRCFIAMASARPADLALIQDDAAISYAELSCRAEAYRRMLVALGAGEASVVAVHLPRSVEAVAAILGILATGASYLPLDIRYPRDRLDFMIQDSGAEAVISDDHQSFTTRKLRPLREQAPTPLSPGHDGTPVRMSLMYTSGSTGRPKGVFLERGAVANRVAWMAQDFPWRPTDRCCQRTPLSFVDSVYEIFGPLCAGISSVIISEATLSNLSALLDVLKGKRISRITLVPSLLEALIDEAADASLDVPDLRLCFVSGEAATQHMAAKFGQALPDATLVNIYGSTEVTADALYHVVEAPGEDALIPIGRPIAGFSALVQNSRGRPVPPLVQGELVIAGSCVAAGYHNRPDLSAEKFVGGAFRTGDCAFIDQDRVVHYRGRIDRQLKVRGQRVEPAEVEAAILRTPNIDRAVVFKHRETLVAACQSPRVDEAQLGESLRATLPPFAVPERLLTISTIPTLPNGKTDLAALLRLAAVQPAARPSPVARSLHPQQAGLTIRNVWRDLLPEAEIDLDSNFFLAGGDSLLAMRMLARVERIFGLSIQLPIFMENPVLGDFAAAVVDDLPRAGHSEWITLRPGRGEAVVCIHGDAFNLVPFLDADLAVHWISQWTTRIQLTRQARALPAESIEALAARYLSYIEQAGASRPVLIGSCAAAAVTLEIGRLITAAGQSPRALILMDLPGGQLRASLAGRFQNRISGSLLKSARGWGKRRLGGRRLEERREQATVDSKINAKQPLTDIEARAYTQRLLNTALSAYEPRPYTGPVKLVFSQHWRRGISEEQAARLPEPWARVFGEELEIHFSPAFHHNDLMTGAGAAFVAELVKELQTARAL